MKKKGISCLVVILAAITAAACGDDAESTTGSPNGTPDGVVRGAASLTTSNVSGCDLATSIEMPTMSGHAVSSSGATQTLYHRQPIGSFFAEATCIIVGGMMQATLASETARITVASDQLVVGNAVDASFSLYVAQSGLSYTKPAGAPACKLTALRVSTSSFLAKLDCPTLEDSAGGTKTCGVRESYVSFENCTPS